MSVIAVVRDPTEIRRVLEHLGEATGLEVPSRAWDPLPVDDWPRDDSPPDDWS